jgi:murein DD-endopeptidase MepM/ murein hydrolase activator NlpD
MERRNFCYKKGLSNKNNKPRRNTEFLMVFSAFSVKLRVLRGKILPPTPRPLLLVFAFAFLFLLGCPPYKPSDANAEAANAEGAGEAIAQVTETGLSPVASVAEAVPPPESAFQGPRFALIPASARPGEPVTVAYSDNFETRRAGNLRAALLNAEGKRLARAAFFDLPREDEAPVKAAILAIPSTAAFGNVTIRIESGDDAIRNLPFTIESRDFPSETVALNQANTNIRTVPDPQKTAESEQLWAILARTGTEIYSGALFMPPVTSTRRTSDYGHRRVYEYSTGARDASIHAGVDYGVPTGTDVIACAQGRVALARPRIVTGNSVVLEHLPGLYSLYYHLDSIAVSEGSIVETGVVLGRSGSTGLATGPHLPSEIRVSTENADPDVFLSRAVLDKNEIFNQLSRY